jgi:hypothetical protein
MPAPKKGHQRLSHVGTIDCGPRRVGDLYGMHLPKMKIYLET